MAGEDSSLTESLLKRERSIVVAGLGAVALLSWAYILAGAGMGMSVRETAIVSLFPHRLAEMPMPDMSMPGMAMSAAPDAWLPGRYGVALLMWWAMMIAMMTPSAAPMILLYARATRHAQATGRLEQGVVPTAAFAGGYLIMWLGFSLLAVLLQFALERSGLISAMMVSASAAVSATILILAGLYQLSPLKHACLSRCRAPAAFISRYWRPGAAGAVRMGLAHGAFCIGCCWMLMALLFVGGLMNVLWIAALAVLVLLEKAAPHGAWLSRVTGLVLLAWGAATLLV